MNSSQVTTRLENAFNPPFSGWDACCVRCVLGKTQDLDLGNRGLNPQQMTSDSSKVSSIYVRVGHQTAARLFFECGAYEFNIDYGVRFKRL
jgi:hypothetical protein